MPSRAVSMSSLSQSKITLSEDETVEATPAKKVNMSVYEAKVTSLAGSKAGAVIKAEEFMCALHSLLYSEFGIAEVEDSVFSYAATSEKYKVPLSRQLALLAEPFNRLKEEKSHLAEELNLESNTWVIFRGEGRDPYTKEELEPEWAATLYLPLWSKECARAAAAISAMHQYNGYGFEGVADPAIQDAFETFHAFILNHKNVFKDNISGCCHPVVARYFDGCGLQCARWHVKHVEDVSPFLDLLVVLGVPATLLDNVRNAVLRAMRTEAAQVAEMEAGNIRFSVLNRYFTEGSIVLFTNEVGAQQVGLVRGFAFRKSAFSGVYGVLDLEVMGYDSDGTLVTHSGEAIVHSFDGCKKMSALPITKATEEDMRPFIERGRKVQAILNNSGYYCVCRPGGVLLYRKPWVGYAPINAEGRVMVDAVLFKRLNPEYTLCGEGLRHVLSRKTTVAIKQIGGLAGKTLLTTDNELLLSMMPCTLPVYSMRCKQWGEMLVTDIDEIVWNDTAFDALVLNPRKKAMIISLVVEKPAFKDIIGGKGAGTIFCLHGTPGTGKTLTAEAVSEHLHKPLYVVTAGELGTDIVSLENKLTTILEIAARWEAVLLIDEADVFMEARAVNDIERNAMVGVFLRLLEYYSGVLFLTTNRQENMDAAFASRITLTLHYPALDADVRAAVWKSLTAVNSEILSLSDEDCRELGRSMTKNGREIKNMLRTALAMAKSEGAMVTKDYILAIDKLMLEG